MNLDTQPLVVARHDEAQVRAEAVPGVLRRVGDQFADQQFGPVGDRRRAPGAVCEHAGSEGPFTVFEFGEQPSVAFAEGRRIGRLIDQNEELKEVSLAYDQLRAAALSPEASIGMIVGAMGQIWIDRD
jgi:hypothetical protein